MVSRAVAERIVHNLESIKVEAKDREALLVAPCMSESPIDMIVKQYTVRQPGEGVVVGDMYDLARLHLQLARPFTRVRLIAAQVVADTIKSLLMMDP